MSAKQLDIGTSVQGSSWGHTHLGVISIKRVFEAMILDEIIKRVDREGN